MAWRNLFRNKGFAIGNILGLTIGMTSAIFILLWVEDELSFDRDQKNFENIYQVMGNRNFSNDVFTDGSIAFPLAKELQTGYPFIRRAVVTSQDASHVFSYNGKKIKKEGITVGEQFFDIFSWKFIKGNSVEPIREPGTIVLTERTAAAFFGEEDAIGKVLKVDGSELARVTAVIADPPANSSFNFDYVEPFTTEFVGEALKEWENSFSAIYLQVHPGTDPQLVDKAINSIFKKKVPEDNISSYFVFPMKNWHLQSDFKDGKNTGGLIGYVRLFFLVAVIILVIACINFMNLSTSRSEKKAREVGVRKTIGSSRKQLILQFFCESILYTIISFLFSCLLILILLPSFNTLVEKHLSLEFLDPFIWLVAGGIILFTGLVSGSYPALYLSSFNPAVVLKGANLAGKRALLPRRILVTSQFVISILLISITLIVYKQIQHIKDRPTGYDSNSLVLVQSSKDLDKNYEAARQELLSSGVVDDLARASSAVTDADWHSYAPDWPGKPKGDLIFTGIVTDKDFAKTLNLKVIAGSYFDGRPSDSLSMLLNTSAVKAMGLKDPVGMQMGYGTKKFTVKGVIDDITMESPYSPATPLMIYYYDKIEEGCLHLRLNKKLPVSSSLKKVEEILNKYNPEYPFEYEFVSKEFNKKFVTEELISKLTNIFAGLAIFLCCIGLTGLTAFTIEKRTREIGIRKVLGASLMQLVGLISKEFVKLVFIAFVITIPATILLMNKWLQNYVFHIDISGWLFFIVGFFILALTLLIVFLNTLKTVNDNPVKSLRTE